MYNLKSNPENLKAWDALQIKIKCCGSAEWKQWMLTVEYVPVSCCENVTINIVFNHKRKSEIFTGDLSGILQKRMS